MSLIYLKEEKNNSIQAIQNYLDINHNPLKRS